MATNAQLAHQRFDQSLWYDNLERNHLRNGGFQALIEQGVRGCTSNPTIFEKAIKNSSAYDADLGVGVARGHDVEAIYYALVEKDVRLACDLLRPVYDESAGKDGYVSVEVQPKHADDLEGTLHEARGLVERIDRANVMIKVPGTSVGLRAVRQLTAEGVSVNVTLIFGVDQYRRVAEAYLLGLEEAARAGRDLSTIASVASFFVSRLDTAIDRQVEALRQEADGERATRLAALLGRAAVANCKRAYSAYQELFSAPRFVDLPAARAQRLLWASTGTKNPAYPDTHYVDSLIGPETVNTLPPATLQAFQDHGSPERRLDRDLGASEAVIADLESLGIRLSDTCEKLLEAGLLAFSTSLDSLFEILAERRSALSTTTATGTRGR